MGFIGEKQIVLITGGAGFIGSNFIPYFLDAHPSVEIVNLDKLTYAGNLANLTEVGLNKRYHFVQGDICDKTLVQELFKKYDVNGVIHFAAESHVDNSIEDPADFIKTNIEGTFILLQAAKEHWLKEPHICRKGFENARFHHISTDEVYGDLEGTDDLFMETTPYAPSSPYSASKASSDHLVRAWQRPYGLPTLVTNCSHNYGPYHFPEKLIHLVILIALDVNLLHV